MQDELLKASGALVDSSNFMSSHRPLNPGRWMTPIACSARSPDLTLLDYFLWGHMKDVIYKTPVKSEDLLARIMAAADIGLPGIGDCVCQNMVHRFRVCIGNAGRNLEPFFMVSMEQRWNVRAAGMGAPPVNQPTSGIVRHDSHIQKSRRLPAENRTRHGDIHMLPSNLVPNILWVRCLVDLVGQGSMLTSQRQARRYSCCVKPDIILLDNYVVKLHLKGGGLVGPGSTFIDTVPAHRGNWRLGGARKYIRTFRCAIRVLVSSTTTSGVQELEEMALHTMTPLVGQCEALQLSLEPAAGSRYKWPGVTHLIPPLHWANMLAALLAPFFWKASG
ncbi:hypothetical protein PR048_012661 [Dryococelus australis]|uniref:Uncharacterized protein n=1 Tax=Dryococelus australis TaxID=614101 RepID=A0ABQ9HQM3_9NEOP|nr:hypothetical protein PR048_012661 [Dryococelus australis]